MNDGSTRRDGSWIVLSLLFTGGLINYLDRAIFGLLAPAIRADLQLTPMQLGLAFSLFSAAYTLSSLAGGWASDNVGARRLLAWAVTFWSIVCGLHAAVAGFGSLLVLRALFGAGEASWQPAAYKLLAQWVSKARYGAAWGLTSAGQPIGGAVGGPLIGLVAVYGGWRLAFLIVGALGLLWVLAWTLLLPGRGQPDQAVAGSSEAAPRAAGTPLLSAIAMPAVFAPAVALCCATYTLTFFISWFPSYLVAERNLSQLQMSLVSTIPWIGAAAALMAGGFVSDFLAKRLGNPMLGRKLTIVVPLTTAAAALVAVPLVPGAGAAIGLMAVTLALAYLAAPSYFAVVVEAVGPDRMGSISGLMIFASNCAGVVSPLLTAYLIERGGGYTAAFMVAAAVLMFGALVVGLAVATRGRGHAPQRTIG